MIVELAIKDKHGLEDHVNVEFPRPYEVNELYAWCLVRNVRHCKDWMIMAFKMEGEKKWRVV